MTDVVIRAESLSKRYRIGERERYLALRDVLARAISAPARLFRPRKPSSPNGGASRIWALKDVSFEVRDSGRSARYEELDVVRVKGCTVYLPQRHDGSLNRNCN